MNSKWLFVPPGSAYVLLRQIYDTKKLGYQKERIAFALGVKEWFNISLVKTQIDACVIDADAQKEG
jgi:hypothetical protein